MPLINRNTVLIGHSLGGIFTLRLLEQLSAPVRAVYLVGTPVGVGEIKNAETDKLFLNGGFNWKAIKNNSAHFSVYHSDNDPYVSLDNGSTLANHLGVNLNFRAGAGHFNAAAGFLEFPNLLSDIRAL